MFYQGQMMPQSDCGCTNGGCQISMPTYSSCNQVVQTCNVQDVPHYVNYNTHIVNNCIKRHINIPTYSTTSENVYVDEYVQAQPMYQQPMFQQPMYQQPMMYSPNQYQGNVGVEGINQQNWQTPNMNNQFNPYNM